MGSRLVEGEEGSVEFIVRVRRFIRCLGGVCLVGCSGCGLGRGEACGELLLHRLHAGQVVLGVEAQTAGRAAGAEEPIPALPGAQEVRADTRATAQLPDS